MILIVFIFNHLNIVENDYEDDKNNDADYSLFKKIPRICPNRGWIVFPATGTFFDIKADFVTTRPTVC